MTQHEMSTDKISGHAPASPSSRRGRWIALEGPDGGGKTSQIPRLVTRLESMGVAVVTTKEPGGTPRFGRALREYLLTDNRIEGMPPEMQLLFFQADRAATVRDIISPAVDAGHWVVCDRGPFGSTVYQGVVQGVDVEDVARLTDWATGGRYPDLTVILDVTPEVALARIAARNSGTNWFDRWDTTKFTRVRNAYRLVAQAAPDRCAVVAADGSLEETADAIWAAVNDRLVPALRGEDKTPDDPAQLPHTLGR